MNCGERREARGEHRVSQRHNGRLRGTAVDEHRIYSHVDLVAGQLDGLTEAVGVRMAISVSRPGGLDRSGQSSPRGGGGTERGLDQTLAACAHGLHGRAAAASVLAGTVMTVGDTRNRAGTWITKYFHLGPLVAEA